MIIQQSNNQGLLRLFLMFSKLSVVYFTLSIPVNHFWGNDFFYIGSHSFPYGLSFGFPPFYSFYLIDHQYVLHGLTGHIIENIIILLVLSIMCFVIRIPNKILNYLLRISLRIIVFYLVSFLYCYFSY